MIRLGWRRDHGRVDIHAYVASGKEEKQSDSNEELSSSSCPFLLIGRLQEACRGAALHHDFLHLDRNTWSGLKLSDIKICNIRYDRLWTGLLEVFVHDYPHDRVSKTTFLLPEHSSVSTLLIYCLASWSGSGPVNLAALVT